jgi:hypothetical protein
VNCLAVFKSNRDAGLILFAALVLTPPPPFETARLRRR